MEPETMGAKLHEFSERQRDGQALTASELEGLLEQLHGLASDVHGLPHGDQQASTAKIDELRKQYTDWYDAAVEQERTSRPVQTLPALEDEYCGYREQWLEAEADADRRSALEAEIIDCLARVDAKPDSDQVASRIRSFLTDEAGLEGF
jgi:hypothetical protein